jgi:hypothetical protein
MERGFDSLAFEYEGNEHSFAASMLVGGETRETVAAVNQFFDGKFQKKFACCPVAMVERRIADQRCLKLRRRLQARARARRKMIRVGFACVAVRARIRGRFFGCPGNQKPQFP